MNSYSSSPSARLSSESTSSASPPRRRLSRANRDNTNMVDASPSPGRPHPNTRSSFLNFSFRTRAGSNPSMQAQSTLNTVRETAGSGRSTDEFGSPRPAPPAPSTSTITPATARSTSPMASNAPTARSEPPGPSGSSSPGASPRQLHPEIRSIVQLSQAHAHKVYYSGPLVKHVERHTDGKIVGKEEPWREVWAQLGGTTLSVWDMKEIEEASKRGAEVPPTYLNITDASIHVLGAVTMPGVNGAPVKYMNVITLTTAGLNLLLFSCPTPQALVAWTAALRLSAYEKSRLEELYTAHLLRMSLSEQGIWKDPRCPLVNGRLEGWVQIRINGQTDWKHLWMCVQTNQNDANADGSMTRKNRMSSLFGRASHEHSNSVTSVATPDGGTTEPRAAQIALYASPRPRDRKKGVLTLSGVTQVFAVYPERPELISRSTLIKMEGFIGDEELAGEWRCREGWLLMMPETEPGKPGSLEMLKWLVGLHDAFNLYGRPGGYTWNPRDPTSLMFAYPVGPHKDNLFLDRELVENIDPREDRGSIVRQKFKDILIERMYGQEGGSRLSMAFPLTGNGSAAPSSVPPSLPPIQSVAERRSEESQESQHTPQNGTVGASNGGSFQLPPLSFDNNNAVASNTPPVRDAPSLSPITERTDSQSQSRGSTQDHVQSPPSASVSMRGAPKPSTIEEESVLGNRRVESPAGSAASYNDTPNEQQREGATSPRAPVTLAPRFSQDSRSASASGSGSGRVTSPVRGMRSPPLSPESSISRYSQPEGSLHSSQHPNSTHPGNTQLSSSEREAPLSLSIQSPTSALSPRMMQQQQHEHEQPPLTPASVLSYSTMMTSPFSIHETAPRDKEQPPPLPSKSPKPQQSQSWEPQYRHRARESEYVFDEPGALYYMQQQRQAEGTLAQQAQLSEDEDESEEEQESVASVHSTLTNPMSIMSMASPSRAATRTANVPVSPVARRQTPGGFEVVSGAVGTAALTSVGGGGWGGRSGSLDTSTTYSGSVMDSPTAGPRGLGRRPSGARAPPRVAGGKRFVPSDSPSSMPREADEQPVSAPSPPANKQAQMSVHDDDETVDALAALSFLEQQDASSALEPVQTASQQNDVSANPAAPAPPIILEPEDRAPSPDSPQSSKLPYRSSFAPSKQAAERKARSQAQQAAHDEAVHKPGRPNGKQRTKQREGGWESSEEEEEEEEEDEDANTDDEPRAASRSGSGAHSIAAPVGRNPMVQQQMRGLSPSNSAADDFRDQQGQQRAVRTLPQIPQRGRSPAGSDRRYDQYEGPRESSMGRPQSQYPQQQYAHHHHHQSPQPPHQQQQLGSARQNMWSSVLDANRDTGMPQNNNNNRDTFVQIEAPAETMTKAFTPQGLLSAGMQDKQDRSAKRQEELAREQGASLINVPNKPPPPQVGLLGAITAHERERKREGGMGAALTEREREKRMAEERQRRLDDLQRQQLEQQQQLAAQFGGGMGMYGGGLSPQMTGMNPMMGGYGGYPQMMGPQSMYFNPMFNPMMGANPQHMFAAQQAAQAYQQAMIAMSTAGSQVGGDGGNAPSGRVSPNMGAMVGGTPSPGPMMGGGMGYDPRMSMMSMGGMVPMMPMGGMPGMASPMSMQMTGGSNMGGMDPRFSLGPGAFDGTGGLSVNHTPGGSGQQSQRVSSYNGSPAASPAPGPSARAGNGDEPSSRGER